MGMGMVIALPDSDGAHVSFELRAPNVICSCGDQLCECMDVY